MAGALLIAAAVLAVFGVTGAPAKKGKAKIRNPGQLVTATQAYTLDKVDDYQRLTLSCPGGMPTYGGG